jgi:hypothetical protein
VYERVDVADPGVRALESGNSASTLLLGRDDGQYFAARGVELLVAAPPHAAMPWRVRLFRERQADVPLRTPLTLAGVWNDGWPELSWHAERALQHGAAAEAAVHGGAGTHALRWQLRPALLAADGDFRFARASLTAAAALPLPLGLRTAVEAAAGSAGGDVPAQGRWYLGGGATVRGYDGGTATGAHFWRGRVELGTTSPTLRLAVFGDAGRAWSGNDVEPSPGYLHGTLLSAGAGVSLVDGLVRIDVARALRGRPGWRLGVAFDHVL